MWKDSDYREIFSQYQATPPQAVWRGVEKILREDNKRSLAYFSRSQQLTLVAASIGSFVLMAFMFRFIETPTASSSRIPVVQFSEIKSEPSKSITSNVVLPPNLYATPSTKNIYSKKVLRKSTITSIPQEWKEYTAELNELAVIDRQIDRLGKEIRQIQTTRIEQKPSPILAVQEPIKQNIIEEKVREYKKETLAQTTRDGIKNKVEKLEEILATNNLNLDTTTFWKRFYFTPNVGINYTQISYAGTPTNSYYSDNAEFSGKMGYTMGLQLGYQLSKHWSVESGINYGQYIQGFRERMNTTDRNGEMYINYLSFPLLARYTFPLKQWGSVSPKAGLVYNSITYYQMNFTDRYLSSPREQTYNLDLDKSQYSSMQLGYSAGFDFDAFVTNKISLNLSILNSLVSQIGSFPLFNSDKTKPVQFSTSFSIGTKFKF